MRKYTIIAVGFIAAIVFVGGISCDGDTTGSTPPKAINPSPANGATDVSVDADLSWNGGSLIASGEADSYTYDVYFGTSASPPLVAGGITSTTYDPGTMDSATAYYWRVDTSDGSQTTTGDLWTFTTVAGSNEIIIGTRDDHINIPFCGGCYMQSKNQELVLASDMDGAGTINGLAYEFADVYGGADGEFYDFELYFCHTTVSDLSNTFEDNYVGNTPVLIASVDTLTIPEVVDTWFNVPGMSSFDYNGSDNLIIEIHWADSNSISFETYCAHGTVNRNLHSGDYSDPQGNLTDHVLRKKLTVQ